MTAVLAIFIFPILYLTADILLVPYLHVNRKRVHIYPNVLSNDKFYIVLYFGNPKRCESARILQFQKKKALQCQTMKNRTNPRGLKGFR